MAAIGALMPAISAGLQLASAAVTKEQEIGAVNVYVDRSQRIADLFNPDKREAAYASLFAEMQTLIAKKGITPTAPYWDETKQEGSPCLSIPLATLKELMDAATR
jgi:hypothetical protein